MVLQCLPTDCYSLQGGNPQLRSGEIGQHLDQVTSEGWLDRVCLQM